MDDGFLTRRNFCMTAAGAMITAKMGIREEKSKIGIVTLLEPEYNGDRFVSWLSEQEKIHKRPSDERRIFVCERDERYRKRMEKRVRRLHNVYCDGYPGFQEMLQNETGKLDAVFIFSPIEFREQYVTECLTRRIPVFCAAPLAQDLETCRRLVSLARKTNTLLSSGRLAHGYSGELYRFCREKLCGSGGLLGECVRLSTEIYLKNSLEMETRRFAAPPPPFMRNLNLPGRQETFSFWKMRGIKCLFDQCLNIRRLYPRNPISVTGFQGPFGRHLSTADFAMFQYKEGDRTFFADLSLRNYAYAVRDLGLFRDCYSKGDSGISYIGDFGSFRLPACRTSEDTLIEMEINAGTDASNYEAMNEECRSRWYPAVRNPKGILGQCVDIAWRHLDYRDYMWRCQDDHELDEERFQQLEETSGSFDGKRNLWKFPEKVLNIDHEAGIENYMIRDFLEMVRTGRTDLESVKEVYRAQVMVCGIAESVRTGKPFHFTPEMFEI